jgi:argininosuccinate lyase
VERKTLSDLLHGGRLSSSRTDVTEYTSSIESDVVLFPAVVKINQAHVIMLVERGIISTEEGSLLLKALTGIKEVEVKPSLEDVHMYVEEEVVKATNQVVGGNLHIAKSRNDQVSTAIRMKLRQDLTRLVDVILALQEAVVQKARQHVHTVFPGYTHLQPAQPITLAHYLVACFDMLDRDVQRLQEVYQRVNKSPMGACALATTSFPISRERVAELLGFEGLLENSVDAVSSRDFLLETQAVLTILGVDVSRLVEDLILWSSLDFGLIELPDAFASTSSIMPQKKNPDVLEVIRARMSHIHGNLFSVTSTLNALPSTYNMDFQEVTPRLWESLGEVECALTLLAEIYPQLTIREPSFEKPCYAFTTSTELANMLTKKYAVPFRTAHKAVGALVGHLSTKDVGSHEVSTTLVEAFLKEIAGLSLKIEVKDIEEAMDPTHFIERHDVRGGPAPNEVKRMIKTRGQRLQAAKTWSDSMRTIQSKAETALTKVRRAYEASERRDKASSR